MWYLSSLRLRPSLDMSRLIRLPWNDPHWMVLPFIQGISKPLFVLLGEGRNTRMLIQSDTPINQNHETSTCWDVQSRQVSFRFHKGQQVRFQIRANPIICHKGRKFEVGHFHTHNILYSTPQEWYAERNRHRLEWLQDRGRKGGFLPLLAEIDREGQIISYKRDTTRTLRYVEFQGNIEITDPDRFVQTLHEGIGSGRTFGCGLFRIGV